ncbi:MAG: hypothetical protein LBU68_01980, partial [Rickettsiales bacterium]|nr:hypothetical protein [Rickettsiales bacterium]
MAKKDNLNLFNTESVDDVNIEKDIVLPIDVIDNDADKNLEKDEPVLSINKKKFQPTDNKKDLTTAQQNKKISVKKSIGAIYKFVAGLSIVWILASVYLFIPPSILDFNSLNSLQMFGIIGVIFFPIFAFWFMAYCIDRISSVRYEQELLYPFLKNILAGDTTTVQSIADMIKINTESELQQITGRAQDVLKIYSNAIKIESNDAVAALKNQLEFMTATTIKIANNSDNIGKQISIQTKELNALLENFSVKTGDILNQEDLISKLYVRLNELAKKILIDLKSVQNLTEELNGKSDVIDRAGTKSVEAIGKISGSIDTSISKFINVITTINDSAKKSDDFINKAIKNIDGATQNMDALTEKTKSVSDYANTMDTILSKRSGDLSDVANVVSTQMRLGEASLSNQSKILSDTAQMLFEKIDDISKKISISVGNVLSLSERVSNSMNGTHKNVMNNAKEIFDAMKSNVLSTDESFEKFQNISENISARMVDVNNNIDNSVNDLKQNFATLTVLMEKMKSFTSMDFNTMLKNRNTELESIFNDMNKKFAAISAEKISQ